MVKVYESYHKRKRGIIWLALVLKKKGLLNSGNFVCIYKGVLICQIFWFIWIFPSSRLMVLMRLSITIHLLWMSLWPKSVKKYFQLQGHCVWFWDCQAYPSLLWYWDWDMDTGKELTLLNWNDMNVGLPVVILPTLGRRIKPETRKDKRSRRSVFWWHF